MTLNQLKYFQTVARLENFHLAASELYISQPSLSRSMDTLEKELGVTLFEKAGRGIALTKSGALFLEHVDSILGECELAVYKIKDLSGAGGRIDIGYAFPLAGRYLPAVIRGFRAESENRRVTFRLFQNHTAAILAEIKKGRLDAGFCAHADNAEELEFFPLLRQEIVLLVPPGHPLSERAEVSVMELARYPVIGRGHLSGLSEYTRTLYRQAGIQPEIVCECPDEYAIRAMVRAGLGIALAALDSAHEEDSAAHEENADGVRVLRIAEQPLFLPVCLVWRKDRRQIPAVQRFLDFVRWQKH